MSGLNLICVYPSPEHWRDYRINTWGGTYTFEMHPYCGPVVLNSRGDPKAKQPGPNHQFWTAVEKWERGGRRVDRHGLCIWADPVSSPTEREGK